MLSWLASGTTCANLFVLWILVVYSDVTVCLLTPEGQVIRSLALPGDYEIQARPVKDPSYAVDVSISVALRSIVQFNDEEQIVSIHSFFDMYWFDEFLYWDPKQYGNVTEVWMSGAKVWKPNINLVASLGGVFDIIQDMETPIVSVTSGGEMGWLTSRVFVRACGLDMTYFPFDVQVCNFTFESRTYDSTKVMLYPIGNTSIDIEDYRKTPDGLWDVTSAIVFSEINDLNWSVLVVEFTFKRKPWYYMLNIITPTVFISFLVPVVFYLPPGSGEKVSMCVTILLAFSVFQLVIADNLPKTSDNTPIIVQYLLCQLILAALASVLTVIVLHFHLKEGATMPKWLHTLVFNGMARVVCMNVTRNRNMKPEFQEESGGKYNTGFFSGPEDIVMNNVETVKTYDRDTEPNLYYLDAIVKIMREKQELSKNTRKEEFLKTQWMDAARVIDRFLMVFYTIINIFAVIAFLGIVPYYFRNDPKRTHVPQEEVGSS